MQVIISNCVINLGYVEFEGNQRKANSFLLLFYLTLKIALLSTNMYDLFYRKKTLVINAYVTRMYTRRPYRSLWTFNSVSVITRQKWLPECFLNPKKHSEYIILIFTLQPSDSCPLQWLFKTQIKHQQRLIPVGPLRKELHDKLPY